MAFIYKKNNIEKIEISAGETELSLDIKKPAVEELLEIYAEYFERAEDEASLPVEMMKKLKDLLVENAVGWQGVISEEGTELHFNQAQLGEILSSDMGLFQSAVNSAMERFFTREREAEKN